MPPNLDELRDRALEEAAKTGTLADIAQAVTIAKAIAEERKADEELAAARRTFTLSRTQSLVAGITAIVSVAGLVATSVYNIAQLSATREQVETTEWRDLLTSIDRLNTRASESSDGALPLAVLRRLQALFGGRASDRSHRHVADLTPEWFSAEFNSHFCIELSDLGRAHGSDLRSVVTI